MASGVKYSLTLGILAGILELVPFVGPIFAGNLTILITLTNGTPAMALYALGLYSSSAIGKSCFSAGGD